MDYETIIERLRKNPRPLIAYEKQKDSAFVPFVVWRHMVEIFTFLVNHIKAGGAIPYTPGDVEAIIYYSGRLHDEKYLQEIGKKITDAVWFEALCELGLEQEYVQRELIKRTKDKQIALKLFVAPTLAGIQPENKDMKNIAQRLRRPYTASLRELPGSTADTIQNGYKKALEIINEAISGASPIPFPCPPFPFPLDAVEKELWQSYFSSAWNRQEIGEAVKAVEQLNDFAIQKRVWNWKQSEEEKEALREELFQRHEDQIREKVHPGPAEQTQGTPDISAKMFEVLKEAKRHKRWGGNAIKAFKYYCEGKTEEEASKLAGITPRTFRNIIVRLQKIFASKK